VSGWKDVPIASGNSEPLVMLNSLPSSSRIDICPAYFQAGISGTTERMYLRESVCQKLESAAQLLPQGYRFLLWDGWRPLQVQQSLFDGYFNQIKAENPGISQADAEALAQTFVSLPSENLRRPSPHFTGGSVDLTITNRNGKLLEMGTSFDDFSPRAATNFFDYCLQAEMTEKDREAIANRNLLTRIMSSVGMTNYPDEWWHFDYGNQFHARMANLSQAIFGPVDLKKMWHVNFELSHKHPIIGD